ncbi:MAG TPA: murein biosynthesis integral membrane protein MurJ [Waddliaceae bacterium]
MKIQDSTRSIMTSAKRFVSGTLISRFSGLAREVAMATVFGTNPMVAAFWMAFRFAYLLRRLFGEGALHAAFVPHFESLRKQDGALGARFFYDLSTSVALLLLLLTAVCEGILGGVLLFGSMSDGNQEIIRLTMLMLPALVFISLYALNTSLLNCENSYFLPSFAPTILNLVWVLAIFLVWRMPISKAIEYLAMIIVLAFAFQWGVTLPQVFRYLTKELGEQWRGKGFSSREMMTIVRPFALGMIGVGATQINSALDTIFARAADPQGPAYLWYAIRIQQLPLALFGIGLTGALLPPISRAIQKGERGSYLHFLNFALKKTFLLMIPMMAAIYSLGFCGINLVYGHGQFSQSATFSTTLCLWAYGAALVPTTLVLIFASAFYAHKNYRIPTLFALLTVILNVSLNALFVFVFHLGAISIALATTLAACVNCVLLASLLKREYGLPVQGVALYSSKVLLATLCATVATLILGFYLLHDNTLRWLIGEELLLFPREFFIQLVAFSTQALCFGSIFFLAAYLLRIRDIFETKGNQTQWLKSS